MACRSLFLLAVVGSALAMSAAENVDYIFGTTMIRFLGKSPNFQIYPNTSLSSYLQLRFSKFEERDVSNQKVQGHSVESLASADPVWTAGNLTRPDGTNLSYVSMAVDPASRNGFSISCPTSGGNGNGNGRRLLTDGAAARRVMLASNITVKVTVYFGLDRDTTFQYGNNKSVSVSKGGLKFNVEYANWPFCNDNNTLGMEIQLMVKGDAAATANVSTGSDGSQQLSISLGDNSTSNVTFANYAYEAKNGTRSMPVGVALVSSGGASTITLKLPNPHPNTTVVYDPTVTTSTYVGGSNTGAAVGVRMTLLTAAVAVVLSGLTSLVSL